VWGRSLLTFKGNFGSLMEKDNIDLKITKQYGEFRNNVKINI